MLREEYRTQRSRQKPSKRLNIALRIALFAYAGMILLGSLVMLAISLSQVVTIWHAMLCLLAAALGFGLIGWVLGLESRGK